MADSRLVAYNPSDKEQRQFLSSLALGESGGRYNVGWGNTDLSGASVDQYGFPQWSGKMGPAGVSHAAGAYQFQPGTWRGIASKYGLNFQSNSDQDAGAWYLAQETYANKTGRSLDADLDAGYLDKINSALYSTWTSVFGNAANPKGLAAAIGEGIGAELSPGATGTGTPSFDWTSPVSSTVDIVKSYFVRGGMIIVGSLILLVALWALLSKTNVLPDAVAIGK